MSDNKLNLQDFNTCIVIGKVVTPINISEDEFKWKSMKVYKEKQYSANFQEFKTNGKEYIPSPKDKLYFFPGCDVPRYKVRDWASKNDAAVTIREDKATVKFAGDNTIKACINASTLIKINSDAFIKWLEHNYDMSLSSLKDLKADIINCANKYVYLNYDYLRGNYSDRQSIIDVLRYDGSKIDTKSTGIKNGFKQHTKDMDTYYSTLTVSDSNWKILKSLENNPDVYNQEKIIKTILEDAPVIDQEMYANLKSMLSSTSKDDKVIAIEVMSNCNIAPSLHHILLLIQQFGSMISNLKESKHVNFKSLLEYVGLTRTNMYGISDDDIIRCLMDKDQLTMQTVKELAEGVKEVWKGKMDTTHFKISKITLSDEVQDYFKKKQKNNQPVTN